jgi:hypothetical protein
MLPGQYDFQIEDSIKVAEKRKQNHTQEYQRRHGKKLLSLYVNQKIVIQTKTGWDLHGYITEVLNNERSYNIITNAGASIRRNWVYEVESDISDDENVEADKVIHDSAPAACKDTPQQKVVPTRKSARIPVPRQSYSCCNTINCNCSNWRRF